MPIWEFVILLAVLIWIGLRIKPAVPAPRPQIGWTYTVVNIAGYEDVEKRLDEIGGWGRELVFIWSPPDLDPRNHVYAIFKEPTSFGALKGCPE
jgi:hypothetical protein